MKRYKFYIRTFFALLISLCCVYSVFAQERFSTVEIGKTNAGFYPRGNGFVSNDGGYITAYSVYEPKKPTYPKYERYERLAKYDINGNLLWYKDFQDFFLLGVCELYDGSVVLCGLQSSNHWKEGAFDQFKTAYIVKLNPCGEVEWAKIDKAGDYPGSVYLNKLYLRTVIDTGDGLIFPYRSDATFQDPTGGHETYEFNTYLLKLSYDGDIIYRKGFKEYGGSQESYGGKVDSEGNIWIAGHCVDLHKYDPRYSINSPLVLKCDSEGNLLYQKSYKDEELDLSDVESRYDIPLIDDNDTFFSILPMTIVVTGPGDWDYHVASSIIKVDKNQNLTTHIIENNDHDPESTCWMQGFDFLDGQEHIITSSRYVCKEIDSKRGREYFKRVANAHYYMDDAGRRFRTDAMFGDDNVLSGSKSDEDDDILNWVRNMLCVIDKDGKVVDSLRLEGIFERGEQVEDIFTVEDNQFVVTSVNNNVKDYIMRIRKFNRDFEPALIDNTPREYDTNCDKSIISGLVEPNYVPLNPVSVSEIRDEIKPIRLSPNPANDRTRIYLSFGFGEKRVEVYDMAGVLVKTVLIGEGWAQEDMDTSDLANGVYVVRLTVNGEYKGMDKLVIR